MNIVLTLDKRPNKRKFNCPNCNKKSFTCYIHIETLDILNDNVGICDRLNNCGYHYTPKQYFEDNKDIKNQFDLNKKVIDNTHIKNDVISYINDKYLDMSISKFNTEDNHFYKFLFNCFGYDIAKNICKRYRIGNSNHWKGANIFWQIDINQKIRTGKIMLYDPDTGKRIKEPFNHVNWVHTKMIKKGLINENFSLKQCFFGEHILKYEPNTPVAIVESEKTAIICYLFHPEFVWLSSGSANGLNIEKCKVLKGHQVVLFPDVKQFNSWNEKAIQLKQELGLNISVNDLLEKITSDTEEKYFSDLADHYLSDKNEFGKVMYNENTTIEDHIKNEFGNWIETPNLKQD